MALMGTSAQASDSAWVLKRGSSYWELQGGYGRFSENNQLNHQMNFLFHGEIGVLENASLLLEGPFVTRSQERPDQTPASLNNNGLTDLYLGGRFRLLDGAFGLAFKPAIRVPVGYDPSFLPVIGAHTVDLEAALTAGYDFKPLEAYIQGGLGFRYRSNFDKTSAILLQGRSQGQTYTKPTDQVFGFGEMGAWITPQLFAAVGLHGEFALTEASTWPESRLLLRPLLAWRLNPYADISLQLDQALWSQNAAFITQFLVGGHFRFGMPLDRGTGLRGSVADYAVHDPAFD